MKKLMLSSLLVLSMNTYACIEDATSMVHKRDITEREDKLFDWGVKVPVAGAGVIIGAAYSAPIAFIPAGALTATVATSKVLAKRYRKPLLAIFSSLNNKESFYDVRGYLEIFTNTDIDNKKVAEDMNHVFERFSSNVIKLNNGLSKDEIRDRVQYAVDYGLVCNDDELIKYSDLVELIANN